MKRILTLLTLCLLFACNKENEDVIPETKLNPLITIDSENDGVLYYGKRFYFVTTLDGELLGYTQIKNQNTNVLYTESAVIPDKFNVHRLYVSNDNEVRFLESFFNTDQTYFTHNPICGNSFESIGNCTIHIEGPTYTNYVISYPSGSIGGFSPNQIYSLNRDIEVSLFQDYNFIFTFLKRDQQYYYKYYFDLNPNEIYSFELDPATMNTNFDLNVLSAPDGMSFSDEGDIESVILSNLCYYRVCALYSEISSDAKTLSIFATPMDHEIYYRCRINLLVDDDKTYTYQKNGELPELIPSLDFDITSTSLAYDNISFTTTGSYDLFSGNYMGENGNLKSWKFYSDHPEMIKFPDIPAEITEQYPTLASGTFFETLEINGFISLHEYSEINNYSDFMSELELNRYLGENSALQQLTVRNY